MLASCASNDMSHAEDPQARWSRGSSRDNFYFMLYPAERLRMIQEINEIPLGTSVAAAIERLSKADFIRETGPKASIRFEPPRYCFRYEFIRRNRDDPDLGEDETVELLFFQDRLVGVESDFEDVQPRPRREKPYLAPGKERVVIVASYPSPRLSGENLKNHRRIKGLLRWNQIDYDTWPIAGEYQILVSRADAHSAHSILCHAQQQSEIVAPIPGCPSTAPATSPTRAPHVP